MKLRMTLSTVKRISKKVLVSLLVISTVLGGVYAASSVEMVYAAQPDNYHTGDYNSLLDIPVNYYYYNLFSDAQKSVWDELDAAAKNYMYSDESGISNFNVGRRYDEITDEEFNEVYQRFRYQNPQYFFMQTNWELWWSGGSSRGKRVQISGDFQDATKRKAAADKVLAQVNEWKRIVDQETTEEGKVNKICELICNKVTYSKTGPSSQTSYAIFDDANLALCVGYGLGFSLMCNACGIPSIAVVNAAHLWNKVRVNDIWYHIDLTSMDSANGMLYRTYLRSSAKIAEEGKESLHKGAAENADGGPICTVDTNPQNAYNRRVEDVKPPTDSNSSPTLNATSKGDGKWDVTVSGVAGCVVYYTTNGETPSQNFTKSSSTTSGITIEVEEGTIVKAVAVGNNKWDSPIAVITAKEQASMTSIETAVGSAIGTYIYDGLPKRPTDLYLTLNNIPLVKGTDYIISSYHSNTNAGTAAVSVIGIGNYYGEKEIEFTINKGKYSTPNISLSYEADLQNAEYTLYVNGAQKGSLYKFTVNGGSSDYGNSSSYSDLRVGDTVKVEVKVPGNPNMEESDVAAETITLPEIKTPTPTIYPSWYAYKFTDTLEVYADLKIEDDPNMEAEYYFTLDDTDPRTSETRIKKTFYEMTISEPITLTDTTTVKFAAKLPDYEISEVATETFIKAEAVEEGGLESKEEKVEPVEDENDKDDNDEDSGNIVTVTKIEMKSEPSKLSYNVNELLDLTGAKITVTKSDLSTEDIDVTTSMISGFDSSIAGTKTVTVTYEGQTTSFDVTVTNQSEESGDNTGEGNGGNTEEGSGSNPDEGQGGESGGNAGEESGGNTGAEPGDETESVDRTGITLNIANMTYGDSASVPSIDGQKADDEAVPVYEYTTVNSTDWQEYNPSKSGKYPVAVGSYKLRVSLEANKKYNAFTAEKVFTISAKAVSASEVTIGDIASDYVYNGSAIEPAPTVTLNSKLLTAGTDYDYSYENNINASSGAKVKVTFKGNYSGEASKTFSINKATITNAALTISGWTAGSQANPANVTGTGITSTSSIAYSYKSKNAADSEYTATVPTVAGKYICRAVVAASANYEGITLTKEFTITEPSSESKIMTLTAPKARSLTYNGNEQALITAGSANNGTIQYKLGSDGRYSTNIPKATAAGTYAVYYKGVASDDFEDVGEASINVVISKLTITSGMVSFKDSIKEVENLLVKNGATTISSDNYTAVKRDNSIVLTGINNCSGTVTIELSKPNNDNPVVTVTSTVSHDYSVKDLKPVLADIPTDQRIGYIKKVLAGKSEALTMFNAEGTKSTADFRMSITDITSTVHPDIKKQFEDAATNVIGSSSVIARYLDLTMLMSYVITHENGRQLSGSEQISHSEDYGNIITLELPDELRAPKGKLRTYYVIRKHGDEMAIMGTTLNDNKITFTTNKFSTYAIAYSEETVNVEAPVILSGNGFTSPKTGDESGIMLWLALFAVSLIFTTTYGVIEYRRNRR